MAWAHVQHSSTHEEGSDANVAQAYPSNVTAGSLLLCGVVWNDAGDTINLSTVTDSLGNTWKPFKTVNGSDAFSVAGWYAANSGGGANTVTATFDTNAANKGLIVAEYSGIATSTPLDQTAGQFQLSPSTSADGVTSGTVGGATAQTNELGWSMDYTRTLGATLNAGSNFTKRLESTAGTFYVMVAEDRNLAVTASTYAGTWTFSDAGSGAGTVFGTFLEPAAGGGASSRTFLLMGVGV